MADCIADAKSDRIAAILADLSRLGRQAAVLVAQHVTQGVISADEQYDPYVLRSAIMQAAINAKLDLPALFAEASDSAMTELKERER